MQDNFNRIDYELEKIRLKNDLLEENKKSFFNLNLMLNTNNLIPADMNLKNINNLLSTVVSVNTCSNINYCNQIKGVTIQNLQNTPNTSNTPNSIIIQNPNYPVNTINYSQINKIKPINELSPFSTLNPFPISSSKMTIDKFENNMNNMSLSSAAGNERQSVEFAKSEKGTIGMNKLSLLSNHQHKDSKSTIINSKDSSESTLNGVSSSTASGNVPNSTHGVYVPNISNRHVSNIVKINLNTITKNVKREISQGKKTNQMSVSHNNTSSKTPSPLTITASSQSKQNLHSQLLSPSSTAKLDRKTSGTASAKPRVNSEEKFSSVFKQNSIGVRMSKVKEITVSHTNTINEAPSGTIQNASSAVNTGTSSSGVSNFLKGQAIVSSKFQKIGITTKSMSVQKSLINVRKK
jgi:hypothetical protein